MIENIEKYLKPKDPDDIDKVRDSVLAQFGPDYCVIATNIAFHMMTSYFFVARAADKGVSLGPDGATILTQKHGGALKEALAGAGFTKEDAFDIINALTEKAEKNRD